MIWGGVARRSGDFWCTRMVLLLFAAEVALGAVELRVAGEKEAWVGFGLLAALSFEYMMPFGWFEGVDGWEFSAASPLRWG